MRPFALTTLATLKDELGITDTSKDAKLTRQIDVQSARIQSFVGYELGFGPARVDVVRASLYPKMWLPVRPLVSVDVISSDTGGITGHTGTGSYRIDAAQGAIESKCGRFHGTYTVTYAAGYVTPQQVEDDASLVRTLPHDIEEACIILCARTYKAGVQAKSVTRMTLLGDSVTFAGSKVGASGLPEDIEGMLTRYRGAQI